MKSIRRNIFAATLAGAVSLSTSLFAQETPTTAPENPAAKHDPWRFDLAVIGWGAAVNGDITVRGRKADVDVGLDEILDHLKGIAMFGVQLRKEKFGFYAQPNWIKLKADASAGPLNGTLEQKLWIVDA